MQQVNKHKTVIASAPYSYKEGLLHEVSAYNSWLKLGGKGIVRQIPLRVLHRLLYRHLLPSFMVNKKEARLVFLGGGASFFSAYPDYINHEIIPLYWDCWPIWRKRVRKLLERKNVRTAIFTSSQVAAQMQEEYPEMNILAITEGIDLSLYNEGKELAERGIDLIEFGRQSRYLAGSSFPEGICYMHSTAGKKMFKTNREFFSTLSNSKITIALPRCITHPEITGDIETLTQRYWENMLSRVVMIGKAPKELIDVIGYNPVIEIDESDVKGQIMKIIGNIAHYQELVDKNREVALKYASWDIRMKEIRNFLVRCGYTI